MRLIGTSNKKGASAQSYSLRVGLIFSWILLLISSHYLATGVFSKLKSWPMKNLWLFNLVFPFWCGETSPLDIRKWYIKECLIPLWHFHVYMYYNPNWFISIFLLSTLAPPLFIVFTFIHMFIYCLGHSPSIPCPHFSSPSLLYTHPTSRQNLFCPLVLQLCWRENIRDNKKDVAFLLVWDKDNYTDMKLPV
jgi:hypothetical protein